MIDPNLVTYNTVRHGDPTVDTLNGTIALQQNRGRLVVSSATHVEKVVVDIEGFKVNDDTGELQTLMDETGTHVFNEGIERSRMDRLGLTTLSESGSHTNRVGQASDDNRDGIWTAPPNGDLRNDGI